ncbi:MAG: glycosyltransferase family 8 protein [Oscillospiraceae bacterium]|jgi:lipopolysaccharide biosynthesis glycosyltransferase|nr:glycosyltransferase family 8 protein [Oscillospiraceae bacterium]
MNILYSCDDKYSPYAGISITSLFENNKDIGSITVYIMSSDISDNNVSKLKKLADNYNREITIIDVSKYDKYFESNNVRLLNNSRATYYRLIAADVLPKDIDRFLYLDCDVIILDSLVELLNFVFEEHKACAMVYHGKIQKSHKKLLRLGEEDLYYYAGIMLFDVKAWKELKCSERILKTLENKSRYYITNDQDIINASINENIQSLAPEYNVISDWYEVSKKTLYKYMIKPNDILYSEESLQSATRNPKILHYAGYKPWEKVMSVKNNSLIRHWDRYKDMSLWGDIPQVERKQRFILKIRQILYKALPGNIYFIINKNIYSFYIWCYYHKIKKFL